MSTVDDYSSGKWPSASKPRYVHPKTIADFEAIYRQEYQQELASCDRWIRWCEERLQQTAIDIRKVCDEVADLLIKKNESYGDSALNPTRIMSKADPVEGILIRIDDKLNRIKQGKDTFNEDAELDLTGYFVLLRIARKRARVEALKAVGAPIPSDEPIGATVGLYPSLDKPAGAQTDWQGRP